jgi:mannose-1-phosphate guanylyltransferase/mannose-6-phosphate isomerase
MRVVILCGGSGTRLWPESREQFPKQFIPLLGDKSLLDLTVERVLSLNFNTIPIFVTNRKYSFLVTKTLKTYNLRADIFLEPEGKNTCAAIYIAAKHSLKSDNLLIMPSDHFIPDNKEFVKDILNIERKLTPDQWFTLGIKPTKPSEAYGYIKVAKSVENNFCKVIKFIEKPTKKIASQFILDNNYYWNAGIFISNANNVLNSVKEHAPDIAKHCDKNFENIKINKETNEFNFSKNLFAKIPSKSVDYAVMEKEKNIYLYPFNNKWSDVGSWDAIAEIFKNEPSHKKIIQIESTNNFIKSKNRTIATIGIKDLIIIDSDNGTLVCKKNNSEKVKSVVENLLDRSFIEAKEHSFEFRPWGKFENILEDKFCKVKKLIINPMKRLSLQYHNFRSEHWLIIHGTARIHLDGKSIILQKGQSIDVPLKSKHFIQNLEDEDLIIIETQLGSYFGEDDIIRLDDPYSR